MPTASDADQYDQYYYEHGCGVPYQRTPEWLQLNARIAQAIVAKIGPHQVLDAGCAMGFLVEGLRELGVQAFGIDISEYAIQQVREDLRAYCHIASLLDPLPQRYDLIVSCEVLEHLSPADAERAIENMCKASDDILFSSTPLDYQEITHRNVQPPEYWAELFALQGFVRDVDFDASFLTPWAVRFRRNREPMHRVLRDYDRKFWLFSKENIDLRNHNIEMRGQLAADEQSIKTLTSQIEALKGENYVLASQIDAITHTKGWALVLFLRRLRRALVPEWILRPRVPS